MKIAILGAGTWGTALANSFIDKHEVHVFSTFAEEVKKLNETHTHKNLPGVSLSKDIVFTSSMEEALKDKELVIFATPSIYIRNTAVMAKPYLRKWQIIVSVAKGIEEGTLYSTCEIIEDVIGKEFLFVALSGPTHAEEVAIHLPSAIVAASKDIEVAKKVQQELSLPYLRIYVNDDIKGVELSGALKNVVALAAGISDGIGYGDNAKAAIITRGLAEISRLGVALGANAKTFSGLTGIGDIVVTATSRHSRNNKAGNLLGQGYSLEETLKEVQMVVEGINCLKAARELEAKVNVEMPIVDAVYSIVYEHIDPKEAVNRLLARDLKQE
ncbi:MAG: NAD(P)-dependent glycerol-3-phosphate dehydrogenase [Bacilli bacterium]|nr:NAD(P)-dependent glycerol-3-phosphate dehydrogenase [Bacilli bacterium]